MNVLVTGGAGYIGSHTIVELLSRGDTVVVVDNLVNSSTESLKRVEKITGKSVIFCDLDLRNKTELAAVFDSNSIDAVIHFAGLKAVGESTVKPLLYYQNNLDSTLVLLETMQERGIKNLVFSSSATVYGSSDTSPLTEKSSVGVGITNPYGQTKYMIECILRDVAAADPDWSITILRYFNPIGAHESGLIGEDPSGIPNNLLPYVSQVAVGKMEKVRVFGNDYDTPDGTGVRDYIHVVDLARGHLAALDHAVPGTSTYNLGTGQGTSVLQLIDEFSKSCGRDIPYEVVARRPGDTAECYADVSLAAEGLSWHAEKSIADACRDTWKWQSQNPNGYNQDKEN